MPQISNSCVPTEMDTLILGQKMTGIGAFA